MSENDSAPRTPLEAAAAIAPLIEAEAAAAETAGRLTENVLEALYGAGLFKLWVSRGLGGAAAGLIDGLLVFERLAAADGAAGWVVMLGAGAGLFSGFLPRETAHEIWADPRAVVAGSGAPSGNARSVAGGYRVSGRWAYASGAHHATWFTANCVVCDSDGRPRTVGSLPLIRSVAVPSSEVTVHSTWAVSGMRATGSEDFEIEECFVPQARTFSLAEPPTDDAPIYRFPFFSTAELTMASVALGIGRHALEEFKRLAAVKRPLGAKAALAEDGDVQVRVARAEAAIASARSFVFDRAHAAWTRVEGGDAVSDAERTHVRLACVDAVARCTQAVDLLHERAGMTPLFVRSAFGRAWRDLHALKQNVVIAAGQYAGIGRALLGIEGPGQASGGG